MRGGTAFSTDRSPDIVAASARPEYIDAVVTGYVFLVPTLESSYLGIDSKGLTLHLPLLLGSHEIFEFGVSVPSNQALLGYLQKSFQAGLDAFLGKYRSSPRPLFAKGMLKPSGATIE